MERDENPRLSTVRSYDDGPLKKLSVDLIQTYKHINDLYYQRKRSGAEQRQNKNANDQIWSYDNDKHDLIINPEETWVINDKRYSDIDDGVGDTVLVHQNPKTAINIECIASDDKVVF